jgi:lipopolysaccharide biosynthesis glycosyltransferase
MPTPECCIVYTTDCKYLFPTLVSAMQARRNCSPNAADVIIFCVGLERDSERVFRQVCLKENIALTSISREMVEGQTAMLARFFLNRYVPPQYSQYLYLDGDVHIHDSLDPLLRATVPVGHFLAANDPMTFQLADHSPQSRDLASHIESIGLSRGQAQCYFNSGVLRIRRQGWDEIGEQAWEYCRRNGGPSRFPDQDALNIVAADRRMPMSLAWNFPVFLRNSRVQSEIKPKITHYMSSPKPWHGSFPPWTTADCEPYAAALRHYPALAPFTIGMPLLRRAIYHLQQRGKSVSVIFTWGLSERRSRILSYEASCPL